MLGGYNMNICFVRTVVLISVSGIFTLPPSITEIPTLLPTGRKKVAFQRFHRYQKLNCRRPYA